MTFVQPPQSDAERDAIVREGLSRLVPIAWAYVAAFALFDLALGAYVGAALMLFAALVLFPLSRLHYRRGNLTSAGYWLVFTLNFSSFAGQAFEGRFAGYVFYLPPLAVLPVLLFTRRQVKARVIGTLIPLAGWLLNETTHLTDLTQAFVPAGFPQGPFHFVNFVSGFAMTLSFIYVYVRAAERARGALELSERSFTDMFDAMVEGVVFQDHEGRILKLNRAAASILGLDVTSARLEFGKTLHVYAPDGRELLGEELPFRRVLRTGRSRLNLSLSVKRADGRTRWLRLNVTPHQTPGEPAYVVTTFTDVTEQRTTQTLLHQIVNGTPDFIFIKDRQHRYLISNDSYAAALGLTPAEIVGRTDQELGFGETRAQTFQAEAERVLAAKKTMTFDTGEVRLGGQARHFHTVKVPLFGDESDEAYGVLTFARDISELKEAERRLADSSKMASLGQMAGGIAHEINNPLAIIGGQVTLMSQQLRQDRLSPEAAQSSLAKISTTVDRIAKIIRGLKTISRNGDQDPFEVVALGEVVEDSLSVCVERFRAHGVILTVDTVPAVRVLGSAAQLSQVLVNLLNNAFDAVEPLGERWVRLSFTLDQAGRLNVAVSNSGPLIPDEVAVKLMQPFYTTKVAGKGTGLGLMLSRRIAERHGGKLYLDRAAEATRFVIDLPLTA